MKLLTKEILARLPRLYSTENTPTADKVVQAKFFHCTTDWAWYCIEGQPEGDDFMFFGLVHGFEDEFGYFSLGELESINGPLGLKIERDLYFKPRPLREVVLTEERLRGFEL